MYICLNTHVLKFWQLVSFEDINSCTQELLKACGITGGQVLRIMTAKSQYGKDLAKVKLNVHLLKYTCFEMLAACFIQGH